MKFKEPPVGSHLSSDRLFYSHHGVYLGNGVVAELAKPADGGRVKRVSLKSFSNGSPVRVVKHWNQLGAQQVLANVERASRSVRYHLLRMNCEHFATLCTTRVVRSRQVESVKPLLVTGAVIALVCAIAQ